MDDLKKIISMLERQDKKLSNIEKMLKGQKFSTSLQKSTKPKLKNTPTATSAIRSLYQNGFFKSKRKMIDIKSTLSSKGMNFVTGHIAQALDRANYLKQEGKRGKFTYIQKYPPN